MPGGLICALHMGQLFWRSNHSEMQASQKMWLQLRRKGSVICSCMLETSMSATGQVLQCIIGHVEMAPDAEIPEQWSRGRCSFQSNRSDADAQRLGTSSGGASLLQHIWTFEVRLHLADGADSTSLHEVLWRCRLSVSIGSLAHIPEGGHCQLCAIVADVRLDAEVRCCRHEQDQVDGAWLWVLNQAGLETFS